MDDATPAGARPLRIVRIVLRVALTLALVVLLVLIGTKQAPKVVAAIAPASPTTTAVAAGTPTVPESVAPSVSATPLPTVSVPTVSLPPLSSGGGSGGGTTTGSGGGTTGSGSTASKPASQTPSVTSLSAPDVSCPLQATGAPDAPAAPTPQVTVRWSTSGGTQAWFGIGTTDAEAAPYSEEPLSGSVTVDYPCTTASQLYTMTVKGPGGKSSRSVTVRNTGHVG